MAGARIPDRAVLGETQKYIAMDMWKKMYSDDMVIINNVLSIESKDKEIYDMMVKQQILSFIRIRFRDKNNKNCILSLESVNQRITWNEEHLKYYRLMAKILAEYVLVK